MSILAIVPARGGSKSIKYKAIVDVNGLPLIYYVIHELLKTPEIDKVVVSTDDLKIKNTVLELFNEKVEVLDRPKILADDKATSESVIEYVIQQLDSIYDYTMLVQCTSPLTEANDFSQLIKAGQQKDSAAFYTRCYSFFFGEDDKLLCSPRLPRQEKEGKKQEAGNAWIFKSNGFLKNKSRLFGDIGLCEIKYPKNLEIDDPIDLDIIKCLLRRGAKCD
jgi:CMP-N-acetylneuraminic acid synthetase